jgi:DNA-binding PadR family transcriptional regulator
MAITPTVFEILLSLADGDRHGYDIMLEVEHRSGGATIIRPGSLYRALHRLLEQGLVEELDERPDAERDDERRRYYHITEPGLAALREEAERMASAVRAVRDKKLMRAQ